MENSELFFKFFKQKFELGDYDVYGVIGDIIIDK